MISPACIPSARDFSARLTAILACVTRLIFARTHIFAALGPPLHNRIAGAARRLATLLARLAAGTFRHRPHAAKPGTQGGPPAALKSLGRTLRPVARLLGVDLPPALLLSPRSRAGAGGGLLPRQPKPPRPKLPPLLPLYPQARPRDLPFMNFAANPRSPKIRPA